MYLDYTKFVVDQLIEKNDLKENDFSSIDEVIEEVHNFTIRPSITYGNNIDWSNIRREEDWILTLQIFVEHGNYLDYRKMASDIRKTIIKHCCYTKINDILHNVNEVSLTTTFNTDFDSISVLVNVNSKEVIH